MEICCSFLQTFDPQRRKGISPDAVLDSPVRIARPRLCIASLTGGGLFQGRVERFENLTSAALRVLPSEISGPYSGVATTSCFCFRSLQQCGA